MKTIEKVIKILLSYENDGSFPKSSLAAMRIIVSDIYEITTLELKKLMEEIKYHEPRINHSKYKTTN